MTNKISPKNASKYKCELCDFNCSKQSDWDRHIMTRKHKILINPNKKTPKNAEIYECECGKSYKHASSLCGHKKRCSIYQEGYNSTTMNVSSTSNSNIDIEKLTDLFKHMLTQNQEFMTDIVEKVIPKIGDNNSTNTNNTNSHNTNNFNIQMFLNDHCKNAMNLTDFIQSLPITSETYDSTITNGLTKTITSMMVNGLNDLDILERPIHCTDASRKTLYVKDSDNWEKDSELLHIMKGIKELSLKQRTLISKWKEVNKGWDKDDNLQSKMTNLVFNSMTQIENDEKETNKIIKTLSKKVYLDNEIKNTYAN